MTEFPFEGWIGWPELEVVLPETQIPLFGDLLWGDKEEEILRKLMGYTYTRREEAGTVILTFNGMMPGGRNAQVRTVISPEHGLEDVYVIWAGYDWNFLYEMKQNFGEGIAVEADGLSVDMNGLHTVASEFVLGAAREIMSVSPGEGMAAESLKEAIYWNQFMPDQLPKEIKDVYRSLHEESDAVMEQPLMNVTSAYYEDETTKNELLIYRYHASAEFIQACLEYTEIQHQMNIQLANELRDIYPNTAAGWFGLSLEGTYNLVECDELWHDALDIYAHAADIDRELSSYGKDVVSIMPDYNTQITLVFNLGEETRFYTRLFPDGSCSSTGIEQWDYIHYLDLSVMGASQPQRAYKSVMLWTGMAITDKDMAANLYYKLLDIWVQSGRTSQYFTVTDNIINIDHLAVTNMTLEEAIVFIEGYGLNYKIDTEDNQWIEPGRVIRISYAEEVLKAGDIVTIYVSEKETE